LRNSLLLKIRNVKKAEKRLAEAAFPYLGKLERAEEFDTQHGYWQYYEG